MARPDYLGQPVSETGIGKQTDRVARCFDSRGRLQRWPAKRSDQLVVLWVIWWQLPDDLQMSEIELNGLLKGRHDYEDYALIRRELIELQLLRRTPDGRVYRKVSRDIPEEAERLPETFR